MPAVEADIRKSEEALERYVLAFEAGTMNQDACAFRIEALGRRQTELKRRVDEFGRPPVPAKSAVEISTKPDRLLVQALTNGGDGAQAPDVALGLSVGTHRGAGCPVTISRRRAHAAVGTAA